MALTEQINWEVRNDWGTSGARGNASHGLTKPPHVLWVEVLLSERFVGAPSAHVTEQSRSTTSHSRSFMVSIVRGLWSRACCWVMLQNGCHSQILKFLFLLLDAWTIVAFDYRTISTETLLSHQAKY